MTTSNAERLPIQVLPNAFVVNHKGEVIFIFKGDSGNWIAVSMTKEQARTLGSNLKSASQDAIINTLEMQFKQE